MDIFKPATGGFTPSHHFLQTTGAENALLMGDIEARLYHQALDQTAGLADPRFRTLFVQRLMLRGHERLLFQIEAKLWAEALRVTNGTRTQAVLWILQNHAEVLQLLNRYHACICARITAVQKALRPYLAQERACQAASTPAVFAAAAGYSHALSVTAQNEANGRQSVRDASPRNAEPVEPRPSLRQPSSTSNPTNFSPNSGIERFSVTASKTLFSVSFQHASPRNHPSSP